MHLHKLCEIIEILHLNGIFNLENFKMVRHKSLGYICDNTVSHLRRLHKFGILTQDVLQAHMDGKFHCYDTKMAQIKALTYLQNKALLTPENARIILRHPNLNEFQSILEALIKSDLLNQDNLDKIIQPHFEILFSKSAQEKIWKKRRKERQRRKVARQFRFTE